MRLGKIDVSGLNYREQKISIKTQTSMISIIIASVNSEMLLNVKQNIEKTIGVPYEIIVFENTSGKKGLCELYNEGARRAKYSFLCFMHEDVEISTFDWGNNMLNIFSSNNNLGLVGVAGCSVRAKYISNWNCHFFNEKTTHINLYQKFKYSKREILFQYSNPFNEKLSQVVCIDGVWMFTRRDIALEIKFDEDTFTGFHCYDIDFSLNVAKKYEVCVTYDVMLTHFSEGTYDLKWLKETRLLQKKWQKELPITYAKFTKKELLLIEKKSHKDLLIEYGKSLKMRDVIDIINECKIYNSNLNLYFTMLKYTALYYLLPKIFSKKYDHR